MNKQENKLSLLGYQYEILDVLEHVSIPDCFVLKNKIGRGHGEAKLYIGTRTRIHDYDNFFNRFKGIQGCFLRIDLDSYLEAAKFEYEEQEQGYNSNILPYWDKNKHEVKELGEIEYFDINESSAGGDRLYMECPTQKSFKIFRQILLPTISYVSILKLKEIISGKIVFYFRPFLDYSYDKRNHILRIQKAQEELENVNIPEDSKKRLKSSRTGQGEYRKRILNEFPAGCLITKINDERLLIASHIKPWIDSDRDEKISQYNGLLLSPTYDHLFDQGFITFKDSGIIITSPYISPLNWRRLSLQNGQPFDLKHNEKRESFLEYHRQKIFKGFIG